MSIIRQGNWLGQQRVDVPNMRALESSIAHDFDVALGKIVSAQAPIVVRGLTINVSTAAGNPATSLVLTTANALVMHFNATEAGTMLEIPSTQAGDVLNSSNANVHGSFAASALNYVGIDFLRSADATTNDQVEFLSPGTNSEVPRTVPTARTLNYVIYITQTPFSLATNICPVAIVNTDANGNVTGITDCRNLFGRLATGGDVPNLTNSFAWPSRLENPAYAPPTSTVDPFSGGDKSIASLKDWMNAIMSVVWEAKSGQYWYSQTVRDGVKVGLSGTSVFAANNDNFLWTWSGASGTLKWQGLTILFENSPQYFNPVADNATTGVTMTAGQCLYVDINRGSTAALTAQVATLATLSGPTTPGSRFILCWVASDGQLYIRDRPFDYNRLTNVLVNAGGYPTYFVKTDFQLQQAQAGTTLAGGGIVAFIGSFSITQSYTFGNNVKFLGTIGNSIVTVPTGFGFTFGDHCKLEDMWFDHTGATTGTTVTASGTYFEVENTIFKENGAGTGVSISLTGNYGSIQDSAFYGCITPSTATGISVGINAVDAFLNNNTFLV